MTTVGATVSCPARTASGRATRFGVPGGSLDTPSTSDVPAIAAATWSGSAPGLSCRKIATSPATWAAAPDVPLIVWVAAAWVFHADTSASPGASTSTHRPAFDSASAANGGAAPPSACDTAPTVIATGARAGDASHASAPELPAATTNGVPAATTRPTASSSAREGPPDAASSATAGATRFRASQSMPASTDDTAPDPSQPRTFTERTRAPGATPTVAPAASAATHVPCPLQSPASGLTPASGYAAVARPASSTWSSRTPVSST